MAMNGGFFRGFYQLKPESGRAKRVGSHSGPPVFSIERAGARGRSAERHVFIPVPCGCMQMTFWKPNSRADCEYFALETKRQRRSILEFRFFLFTVLLPLWYCNAPTIGNCKENDTMKAHRIYYAIVAFALAFGSASANAQTTFTFTQLDVPGSVSTEADGINAQGQIIGVFVDGAGKQHGFL